MDGEKQVERNVIIYATPDAVWAVLADSRLLPRWAPIVDEVTACAAGGEAIGAVRHCTARLAGRAGGMVERCVELLPGRRIAYVVDEESFGMRRMFDDYGFALDLEPGPERRHTRGPPDPLLAAKCDLCRHQRDGHAAPIRRRMRGPARGAQVVHGVRPIPGLGR